MGYIAGNKEFATPYRLKLNLQLFADGEPQILENTPEFKEDLKEFSAFEEKMAKFTEERKSKETVKEPAEKTIEKEPVKETVKAESEEVATPEQKPKQDKETNDAFQEQRKAREAAEAKAKLLEEKANKADALIKAQFGSQGITTVEQYEQWIKDGEEEANEERYRESKLTDEEREAIKNYKPLKESVGKQTEEQTRDAYLSQWDALYKVYPDLLPDAEAFREAKDPTFYTAEMKAAIARGASPLEAYRNAHFETILANATKSVKEAATQDAVDKLSSKNHIKTNANGGDVDSVQIPEEQMRIFRALNKGKSDAEIRKFYKKQIGG